MNELYRRLTGLLKKAGYALFRQGKGSHEIWCKNGKDCVTVPVTIKSRHLANEILKDVKIKEKL